MTDWLGLRDARVVVVGGAGTLGAAIADGFLEVGARVAAIDVSGPRLAELGERVAPRVVADLRSADACRDAIAQTLDGLGGIDVFVHCAGINDRKPIEDYRDEEWDEMVAVNLSSAFRTLQAVASSMRAQRHGRIVLVSSVAGRSGHRNHGPYAATKGAINQLTRVAAHEYAADGVTVNAIAPGYMETALTSAYLAQHPDKAQALVGLIPAGRFGALDEVVGPVLFLASRQAAFVNGHVLYVDGGRSVV